MELDRNRVAEGDLLGGAEDVSHGIVSNGISALEDAKRTALLQLQTEPFDALSLRPQQTLGPHPQIGRLPLEADAQPSNLCPKIERHNANMRAREAFARLFESRAQAERQPRGVLIGALPALAKKIERPAKTPPRGELVDAAA